MVVIGHSEEVRGSASCYDRYDRFTRLPEPVAAVRTYPWQARVEHLEQAGGRSTVSVARLACLTVLNLVVDMWMVSFCIEGMALKSISVNVLFAFGGCLPLG